MTKAPTITDLTSTSLPIVRRPSTPELPWSSIEDGGAVKVAGKLYYWDAVRTYDRKAPKGERVTWEVELSHTDGRRLAAHCFPEARKAILSHFKDRIEADNARIDAEYWADRAGVSVGETDDTVAADVAQAVVEPTAAPVTIKEQHGTSWSCAKTFNGKGDRSYWVSFDHGPSSVAKPGVVGFYASSIEEARKVLEAPKVRASSFLSLPAVTLALTDDLAAHIARHSIAPLGADEVRERLLSGQKIATGARTYSIAGEA